MELTQEQMDTIIAAVAEKSKKQTLKIIDEHIQTKGFLTKMDLENYVTNSGLTKFQTDIASEIAKTNAQVNTLAEATETRIKKLEEKPAQVKSEWFAFD